MIYVSKARKYSNGTGVNVSLTSAYRSLLSSIKSHARTHWIGNFIAFHTFRIVIIVDVIGLFANNHIHQLCVNTFTHIHTPVSYLHYTYVYKYRLAQAMSVRTCMIFFFFFFWNKPLGHLMLRLNQKLKLKLWNQRWTAYAFSILNCIENDIIAAVAAVAAPKRHSLARSHLRFYYIVACSDFCFSYFILNSINTTYLVAAH